MSTRKKCLIIQIEACLHFIWKDMRGGDARLIDFWLELGLAMYFQTDRLEVCLLEPTRLY